MRYTFGKNEVGQPQITFGIKNDEGVGPKDLEDLFLQIINKICGQDLSKLLTIDVTPRRVKRLTDDIIIYINEQENNFVKDFGKYQLNRIEFYALVFKALQKLRYKTATNKEINQSVFSKLFGLRRASINIYVNQIDIANNEAYKEIERLLFKL